ncbi:hypothetical protein CRM22_007122 [Opisthorchis felineus]|uniref:Uncharacterized protein n=1 Tax=Opisthorchis felineus TaxID=147828 RepID=A0A4S2LHH3_OPIFE|nr:hypothetical protein CRM22_007122 [Opisthorchis felineus]
MITQTVRFGSVLLMSEDSDSDSILTEEYASKFEEIIVPDVRCDRLRPRISNKQPECKQTNASCRNTITQSGSVTSSLDTQLWNEEKVKTVSVLKPAPSSAPARSGLQNQTGKLRFRRLSRMKQMRDQQSNSSNPMRSFATQGSQTPVERLNRTDRTQAPILSTTEHENEYPGKQSLSCSQTNNSKNEQQQHIIQNSWQINGVRTSVPTQITSVDAQATSKRVPVPTLFAKASSFKLTQEEVEQLIAERDELYEILRLNEEEESVRYAKEKSLAAAKQESLAERQRLRQRINALEEELEVSLCEINKLSNERNRWTRQMDELRNNKDELQHLLDASIQRHEKQLKQLEWDYEHRCQAVTQDHCEELRRLAEEGQRKEDRRMRREKELEEALQSAEQRLAQVTDECNRIKEANASLLREGEKTQEQFQLDHKKLRQELAEKEDELSRLQLEHTQALAECVEKMRTEKSQVVDQLKSSYMKQIDELQNSLNQNANENRANMEKIAQLEQMIESKKAEQHKEALMEKMLDTMLEEISDWERQKVGVWQARLNDVQKEANDMVACVRAELQKTREETNVIVRQFDEYKKAAEEEMEKLRRDLEQAGTSHQLELTKRESAFEEKIAMLEFERAMDARKLLEEKLTQLRITFDEQIEQERQEIHADVQRCLQHHMFTWDGLLNDAIRYLDSTLRMELSSSEEPICKDSSTSTRLDELNQTVPNSTCFGQAGNQDWKSLLLAFSDNVQQRVRDMRSIAQSLLAEQNARMESLRSNAERHISDARNLLKKTQKKFELELEELREREHEEYQRKLAKLRETSPNAQLVAQLKRKGEELLELQEQMDRWKQETVEKLKTEIRKECTQEFEQFHQPRLQLPTILSTSPVPNRRHSPPQTVTTTDPVILV